MGIVQFSKIIFSESDFILSSGESMPSSRSKHAGCVHVSSGHVVLVVALCRPACCARADCTKTTCPLCYRRMLAAPELCPCLDTGGPRLRQSHY